MGKWNPSSGKRMAAAVPGPDLGGPSWGKKTLNTSPSSSRKRCVTIPKRSGRPYLRERIVERLVDQIGKHRTDHEEADGAGVLRKPWRGERDSDPDVTEDEHPGSFARSCAASQLFAHTVVSSKGVGLPL